MKQTTSSEGLCGCNEVRLDRALQGAQVHQFTCLVVCE